VVGVERRQHRVGEGQGSQGPPEAHELVGNQVLAAGDEDLVAAQLRHQSRRPVVVERSEVGADELGRERAAQGRDGAEGVGGAQVAEGHAPTLSRESRRRQSGLPPRSDRQSEMAA
jgi:hypothetical protein